MINRNLAAVMAAAAMNAPYTIRNRWNQEMDDFFLEHFPEQHNPPTKKRINPNRAKQKAQRLARRKNR